MQTPKDNRLFLLNVVIPRLEEMYENQAKHGFGGLPENIPSGPQEGLALLHFDVWFDVLDYTDDTDDKLTLESLVSRYECGRTGCLGGWYGFFSEDRLPDDQLHQLSLDEFTYPGLAVHFGIKESRIAELFESHGRGIERKEAEKQGEDGYIRWCEENLTPGDVLRLRKEYLIGIMKELGDLDSSGAQYALIDCKA